MVKAIKYISEINAVSGNEQLLRKYIIENISADSVEIDTMGNIVAMKKGSSDSNKKIAYTTNMDECGMIVTDITDEGYIKFDTVGSVEMRSIISKPVVINNSVKGIIGMKAIHLQKKEERENVKKAKELFIDIGAQNNEDAKKIVSKGDYISFSTNFTDLGNNIKGKALSRIGVYVLMQIIKQQPVFDTYYIFTTQKEVGHRGAMVVANRLNIDCLFVLDAVCATDVYGVKDEQNIIKLGLGPVLSYSTANSIADKNITNQIIKYAKSNGIDVQLAAGIKYASDAGEFMLSNSGIKTVNIQIPVRYINTPVQICSKNDIKQAEKLLGLLTKTEEI